MHVNIELQAWPESICVDFSWFQLRSGSFQLSIKLSREEALFLLSAWAASWEHFGSSLEHFASRDEQKQGRAYVKAAKSGNATLHHFRACSHPFSCFSCFLLHLIWCNTPSDFLLFQSWTPENHENTAEAYTFLNFNIFLSFFTAFSCLFLSWFWMQLLN